MKDFLAILAVLIVFGMSGSAQTKTAVDPCLSKDPKIRAVSKKPCPSAPSKKNNQVNPPKGTDDGETSDDSEEADNSPSNSKANKKPEPPSKNKTPKNNEGDGTMFFIEIVHNGEKTEMAYTQFEEHGGFAVFEGGGRLMLSYGAGNSTMNNDDFAFQGMIPTAARGSYLFHTDGVMFSFKAAKFPNVPIFLCDSGGYEITAVPLPGGFVEGTFTANCIGEVHDDGSSEKYTMSGRFKLMRAA